MTYIPTAALLNQNILPRLDKVKAKGQFQWTACCPAHKDKSPSFQIKLADDGRILFHCFSGCTVSDICSALDLGIEELFPDTSTPRYPSLGHRQAINRVTEDCHYIAVFKSQIKQGYRPTAQEKDLYLQAVSREARA